MKHSRRGAVGATAAGLAIALSACGGGAQPGDTEDGNGDSGGGDGEANAWILTGGGWPAIEASFDRWNENFPDQQISVDEFENDAYKERIRTSVGADQAPTLIMSWGGGTLDDYADNEQVLDITDETEELRDRVMPSVADNGEIDGTTYAVPMN